jgi:hypothetical protein
MNSEQLDMIYGYSTARQLQYKDAALSQKAEDPR